ncbi:MAG: hypothetical protein PUB19_01720 [Lachnospiraceae bacterium]|nr:hypothetical protein [Lachnospiraceae bacterium]
MKNENTKTPTNNSSNLAALYKFLKPTIFNNQVIFYNLLFTIYRDLDVEYLNELRNKIDLFFLNKEKNDFQDAELTKDFYRRMLNLFHSEISKYYPNTKTNTVTTTSARVNISNLINKKDASAIPKYWRAKYLNLDNIDNYKNKLDIVLKYYLLAFNRDSIDMINTTDFSTFILSTETLSALSTKTKDNAISLQDINTLDRIESIEQLESIIINQINLQCKTQNIAPLHSQMEEYQKHVECYGDKNLNKFYTLQRYAEKNIYASYKLGDLYYYGSEFYTEERQNKIVIEPDIQKAKYYYSKCAKEPTILAPGCWSLGFILFEEAKKTHSEKLFAEARKYLELCEDYSPALQSLGKLELYLAESMHSSTPFSQLNEKEQEDCLLHYISFIKYCFSACHGDWVYSFNTLYNFYTNPKYNEIKDALKKRDKQLGTKDYIDLKPQFLLEEAVKRENPWAKETLAMQYIRDYILKNNYSPTDDPDELLILLKQGKYTLKNTPIKPKSILPKELFKAKKLLKELNKLNYDRATYHLAINFYYDTPNLSILLEKAAKQGHAQAMNALNELKLSLEYE